MDTSWISHGYLMDIFDGILMDIFDGYIPNGYLVIFDVCSMDI